METHKQSPEAQKAIDALLFYLQSFVAPKIAMAFKQYAPHHGTTMLKYIIPYLIGYDLFIYFRH